MAVDTKKEQERDELHRAIWAIADELRGAVDGWDFKNYVLGTMFYRYISEKLADYINKGEEEAGNAGFKFEEMSDSDAEEAREGLIQEQGFFILPSELFCNVVKRCENDEKELKMKNCWKYLVGIMLLWIVSMPFWKAFINGPMASNGKEIVRIVYPLIPFYVTYLVSAVIDGWFVSKGKTLYNAINSVIVNIGYYGIVYMLFKHGVFTMNMNFIVMMFGFGMVVHMISSIIMYRWELKKTNISIAN